MERSIGNMVVSAGGLTTYSYTTQCSLELLGLILGDAGRDISVAALELGLSDASFVRLRRVMDRVACAQSVLETMGARSAGAECGETAKCAEARMRMRMVEAVELLARGWPEDYPAGAVERMLVETPRPPLLGTCAAAQLTADDCQHPSLD